MKLIPLDITETITTPKVLLDANAGMIRIEGRSIPENVMDFYQPILNWIDEYVKNPQDMTEVHLQLEYFNTSSSKRLFDLMRKIEAITDNAPKKAVINWYYEEDDEDIYFAGSDYKVLIKKVDFNLIEIHPQF